MHAHILWCCCGRGRREGHPPFPNFVEAISHDGHAQAVERYDLERLLQLHPDLIYPQEHVAGEELSDEGDREGYFGETQGEKDQPENENAGGMTSVGGRSR